MLSRVKSETSQLAVIRSIAYLQLTPVMTEVLTILTGLKARKGGELKENEKQRDFRGWLLLEIVTV